MPAAGDLMTTLAPSRRPLVSADPLAAVLLVVGGGAGLIGFLLPWLEKQILTSVQTFTGWSIFRVGLPQGSISAGQLFALYALLCTALAGGACILLGIAMLLPLDHHPLGAIAMLLGLGSLAALAWWTFEWQRANNGLSQLFDQIQVGWYLAAASGVLAVVGAIRALARA